MAKKRSPLNVQDYVKQHARMRTHGCPVCQHPQVKEELTAILEECANQGVQIAASKLIEDFEIRWKPWRCSDKKFRKHMRGICDGE